MQDMVLRFLGFSLVVALLTTQIDLEKMFTCLKQMYLPLLLCAGLLNICSLYLSAWRSRWYFSHYGHQTSDVMLKKYLWGAFLNTFILGGIGGDGYRVLKISCRYNLPKIQVIRIIFYERVSGVHAILILAMLTFYCSSFSGFHWLVYCNTALLIMLTPCYLFLTGKLFKDQMPIMLKMLPISLLVQLLQVLMALTIFRGLLGAQLPYQTYIDLTVLFLWASFLVVLPISVGGIGVRELVFAFGYAALGMSSEQQALAASVGGTVFITTFISTLFGALSYTMFHHYKTKISAS
jgi:uncharacterized membrane protein YbhN (UPF0104 family)